MGVAHEALLVVKHVEEDEHQYPGPPAHVAHVVYEGYVLLPPPVPQFVHVLQVQLRQLEGQQPAHDPVPQDRYP